MYIYIIFISITWQVLSDPTIYYYKTTLLGRFWNNFGKLRCPRPYKALKYLSNRIPGPCEQLMHLDSAQHVIEIQALIIFKNLNPRSFVFVGSFCGIIFQLNMFFNCLKLTATAVIETGK